ncbi:MAG: hypothetical protein AAAB35_11835 [Phyllobacterium sp.]|uniref:hypothetical protein n=1 Tax=Phyllobacterium sp. TaxID=1871046 RepID=UPI0030F35373
MNGAPRQVFVRIGRLRIESNAHAGLSASGVSSDIQAAIEAALAGTGRPMPGHPVGGIIAGEVASHVRQSLGQVPGGPKAGPRR